MFKFIHNTVWVFDVEWVPDPWAGRLLYQLPGSMSDEEVIQEMWKMGGATEEEPMPYLKTVLCRVVSISAVIRIARKNEIKLQLLSVPRDHKDLKQISEAHIVRTFLDAVGTHQEDLLLESRLRDSARALISPGKEWITSPGQATGISTCWRFWGDGGSQHHHLMKWHQCAEFPENFSLKDKRLHLCGSRGSWQRLSLITSLMP
jgi:hypothetical protein